MAPRQAREPVAHDRKWYVMAAVGMSNFLATLDLSIVNVALPTLVRDCAPTSRRCSGSSWATAWPWARYSSLGRLG